MEGLVEQYQIGLLVKSEIVLEPSLRNTEVLPSLVFGSHWLFSTCYRVMVMVIVMVSFRRSFPFLYLAIHYSFPMIVLLTSIASTDLNNPPKI